MTRLVLIRHAPTIWNEAGRIQGRSDTPLSANGKAMAASWRLPAPWRDWPVFASPLARARDTARLMRLAVTREDNRLIEMDWGRWAGETLAELRAREGEAMARNEAQGLDFRPEGGESPREVTLRLAAFLRDVSGENCIAVTHRGVIRAALVLATGWDMRGPPPLHMARDEALILALSASGEAHLARPARCSLESVS